MNTLYYLILGLFVIEGLSFYVPYQSKDKYSIRYVHSSDLPQEISNSNNYDIFKMKKQGKEYIDANIILKFLLFDSLILFT